MQVPFSESIKTLYVVFNASLNVDKLKYVIKMIILFVLYLVHCPIYVWGP
jgi:hypothetical protein